MPHTKVTVMGAGCIGAWVGGQLALGGAQVTLVGRPRLARSIDEGGLHVATLDDEARRVPAGRITVVTTPEQAAAADVVLVSVKGGDTTQAARQLAPTLHSPTAVISLQNGLDNPARIRHELTGHAVLAGMVPFNVVWQDRPEAKGVWLTQATSGEVVVERPSPGSSEDTVVQAIFDHLRTSSVSATTHPDMAGVQRAKLVLNLNNAVNALSGLPLRNELSQRGYRRVLAAAMTEALATFDRAGQSVVSLGRMRPRIAPWILPLPTALFSVLAAPMIRIAPTARSSMADDLARGRRTEVDDIQGAIVRLGAQVGHPTPVNAHLQQLVHNAETNGAQPLPAEALWPRA